MQWRKCTHSDWLDKNNKCYNHRMQALKYMIKIKIYSRTRYNNRGERKGTAFRKKFKNILNK